MIEPCDLPLRTLRENYKPLEIIPVDPELQTVIGQLETQSGITTEAERLLKAVQFIEPALIFPEIVADRSANAERIFGHEQWASYLEASLIAEQWQGPCTVEFICSLYDSLCARAFPGSPSILDAPSSDGYLGLGGMTLSGRPYPTRHNAREIAMLNDGPYTEWLPVAPWDGATRPQKEHYLNAALQDMGWVISDNSDWGFINYTVKKRAQKLTELQKICNEYNNARTQTYDPDQLAGDLQYKLVALHAGRDGNGTAARVVMNWSLRKDGLGPSLPYSEFETFTTHDDDLFIPPEYRGAYVHQGRKLYDTFRQRVADGITDPAIIFELERERATCRKYNLDNLFVDLPPGTYRSHLMAIEGLRICRSRLEPHIETMEWPRYDPD